MQCKQFLEEQLRDKGGIVPAYQVAGEYLFNCYALPCFQGWSLLPPFFLLNI